MDTIDDLAPYVHWLVYNYCKNWAKPCVQEWNNKSADDLYSFKDFLVGMLSKKIISFLECNVIGSMNMLPGVFDNNKYSYIRMPKLISQLIDQQLETCLKRQLATLLLKVIFSRQFAKICICQFLIKKSSKFSVYWNLFY